MSSIAGVCLESHANAVSVQIWSMRVVNVSRADQMMLELHGACTEIARTRIDVGCDVK